MTTQVSDKSFENDILQSELPVLVDFWAPWCGPCRAIAPVLDELSEEFAGQVKIVKINVDENPAAAGKYSIRAIPTLILFNKGEVIEQVTGAVAKSNLKRITLAFYEYLVVEYV